MENEKIEIDELYAQCIKILDTSIIDNKLDEGDMQYVMNAFSKYPQLLFYTPEQKNMFQINYARADSDSFFYKLLRYPATGGYSEKRDYKKTTELARIVMSVAMKNEKNFENVMNTFFHEDSPPTSNYSRMMINKADDNPYEEIGLSIFQSEHFTKDMFMQLLDLGYKARRDHRNAGMSRMFENPTVPWQHMYVAISRNFKNKEISEKLKSCLHETQNEKAMAKTPIFYFLDLLSNLFGKEFFNSTVKKILVSNQEHLSDISTRGISLGVYVDKSDWGEERKTYALSLIKDLGGQYITPTNTNKFLALVYSLAAKLFNNPSFEQKSGIFLGLDKTHKNEELEKASIINQTIVLAQNRERIKKLDFSKFTSTSDEAIVIIAQLLNLYDKSSKLLEDKSGEMLSREDKFFISNNVLDKFFSSTFDFVDTMGKLDFISKTDVQGIFSNWSQEFSLANKRVDNIALELKESILNNATKSSQVRLNVMKANAG